MSETNEETKVEETTAPASEAEETTVESTEETTTETTEETTDVDYKKELEDAETRLGKAEYTIVKEKDKTKEAKEEVEKVKSETPSIDEIKQAVREENQDFHKKTRKNDIESKIRSMTGSEDEAKLAILHYNNSITVSGNDSEDVENSILLANKKRYSSSMSEIAASNRSKDTVQTTGGGAGQKVSKTEDKVEYSKEDTQVMKSFGLTPEQMKNGYDRNAEKERVKKERIEALKLH